MSSVRSFINPEQTIQDLTDAVELLESGTVTWIQGYDSDGKGGRCAFGAIRSVVGDDGINCGDETMERAANAGRAFYRVIGEDLVTYNDKAGRTKDQVVRAIQTVIDTLRKDPSRA